MSGPAPGAPDAARARPLARPLLHAAMGLNALWLGVLPRAGTVAMACAALVLNWLVMPRTRWGRALERPGEPFVGGLRTYPLAVLGLVLLLPPAEAAAAWGILAFGDSAAALVGARVRSPALLGHRKATWAGSGAFLLAGTLAAWGLAHAVVALAGSVGGVQPGALPTLPVLALAALAAALLDLVRIPPDDNLPCAAACAGTLHLLRGLL
ncbi:MAG: hypothetical protein ACKOSS_05815 [Planctomycetia bacterium]